MTSLLLLAACAFVPWMMCSALEASLTARTTHPATRERALGRYRRATLCASLVMLPAAGVAGALVVDPSLSTRSPTAGSWFFASLSATTAWVSFALARRTSEEAAAMPALETTGRAVQIAAVPVLATALALLAHSALQGGFSSRPIVQAVITALCSVVAVIVVSPLVAMKLGLWPILPRRLQLDGVSWRLAHLPAPTPFLTHTAAVPWLRSVLVSDGLFNRAPEPHWQTLIRYEVGDARTSRAQRLARWAFAIVTSALLFIAAGEVGARSARKLVAATVLTVFFTAAATWWANREPSEKPLPEPGGPSMRDLAQMLRSLPPCLGQALPRTSRRPLGSALYDRLFALGHDPGPRPHR